MLCNQRQSPHTKIKCTFNVKVLGISLVLKWTYSGEKVLGLNFFKRREYSDFIAWPSGDISSTRKPA